LPFDFPLVSAAFADLEAADPAPAPAALAALDGDFVAALDGEFVAALDGEFAPALDGDFAPALDGELLAALDGALADFVEPEFTRAAAAGDWLVLP
jgi:Ser/Thr protein kinase RdoA (MazF antagonist)